MASLTIVVIVVTVFFFVFCHSNDFTVRCKRPHYPEIARFEGQNVVDVSTFEIN